MPSEIGSADVVLLLRTGPFSVGIMKRGSLMTLRIKRNPIFGGRSDALRVSLDDANAVILELQLLRGRHDDYVCLIYSSVMTYFVDVCMV